MTESTELYSSICEVMTKVGEIHKDATNKYAGYNYASADSVFEKLRKLMGKNNLVVSVNEVDFNMHGEGNKPHARVVFDITLAHALTGEITSPERITVQSQYTGPQSVQAIRTYALKYWLRAKFLLSTGETDIDAEKPSKDTQLQSAIEDFV